MMIYLAGPMENAPDNGRGWRATVTPALRDAGFDVIDPTINEEKGLSDADVAFIRARDLSTDEKLAEYRDLVGNKIVIPDLAAVWRCDAILCMWEGFSAGTAGELTFAKWHGIPVYASAEDMRDVPGWIVGCVTRFFPTIDDAAAAVCNEIAASPRA